MLIARAPTTTIVTSEIAISIIMSALARAVTGVTSVVLNAVAVDRARYEANAILRAAQQQEQRE